jgi:hypothetical protein
MSYFAKAGSHLTSAGNLSRHIVNPPAILACKKRAETLGSLGGGGKASATFGKGLHGCILRITLDIIVAASRGLD